MCGHRPDFSLSEVPHCPPGKEYTVNVNDRYKFRHSALDFHPNCLPCMVPDWHYWHTRSSCRRRPDPSSLVVNSRRLQQCQPRPLSDCQQRWDRCHCLPNLKLSGVELSLIALCQTAAYHRQDLADQQNCLHHREDAQGCRLRYPPARLGFSIDFV